MTFPVEHEHQASFDRVVRNSRALNVIAGSFSVCLAVAAWRYGSLGWLVAYLLFSVALFTLVATSSTAVRRGQRRLDREWGERFHQLAIRDELTGLYNRRYFNSRLAALIPECRHARIPLTVALLDLNDFKAINDSYGHQGGDRALQTVADVIVRSVGESGVVARTGGDEFAVIFPGVDSVGATQAIMAARVLLDATPLLLGIPGDPPAEVRAAVGLATLDDFSEADRLLLHADNALYENKRELGRLHERRRAS